MAAEKKISYVSLDGGRIMWIRRQPITQAHWLVQSATAAFRHPISTSFLQSS